MNRRRWTEEEDAKLRRCYGILECEVIAKHLGRTRASVWSRAYVLGLPRRGEI
jgi:hypothetical protein